MRRHVDELGIAPNKMAAGRQGLEAVVEAEKVLTTLRILGRWTYLAQQAGCWRRQMAASATAKLGPL